MFYRHLSTISHKIEQFEATLNGTNARNSAPTGEQGRQILKPDRLNGSMCVSVLLRYLCIEIRGKSIKTGNHPRISAGISRNFQPSVLSQIDLKLNFTCRNTPL